MNRLLLDPSRAEEIANEILSLLDDAGYTWSEYVPALVQAIVRAADGDDAILDAAANFLADGGVEPEPEADAWAV